MHRLSLILRLLLLNVALPIGLAVLTVWLSRSAISSGVDTEPVAVAFYDGGGQAAWLVQRLDLRGDVELLPVSTPDSARSMVVEGMADLGFALPQGFDTLAITQQSIEIAYFYADYGARDRFRRFQNSFEDFEERILTERLAPYELPASLALPIAYEGRMVGDAMGELYRISGLVLGLLLLWVVWFGAIVPADGLFSGSAIGWLYGTLLTVSSAALLIVGLSYAGEWLSLYQVRTLLLPRLLDASAVAMLLPVVALVAWSFVAFYQWLVSYTPSRVGYYLITASFAFAGLLMLFVGASVSYGQSVFGLAWLPVWNVYGLCIAVMTETVTTLGFIGVLVANLVFAMMMSWAAWHRVE